MSSHPSTASRTRTRHVAANADLADLAIVPTAIVHIVS